MLVIKSIRAYHALSEAQKVAIKNQGASGEMSIHKWMHFLKPICRFDEIRDQATRQLWGYFLVWVITVPVAMTLSQKLESNLPILLPVGLFVLLVALWFYLRSMNADNNIRQLVYPLLHLLSLDIGNGSKVTMNFKFGRPARLEEPECLPKGDRNTSYYQSAMLDLSCGLPDGTRLKWVVRQIERKRIKRNPRGKIKVKFKFTRLVATSMTFDAKVYSLRRDVHLPSKLGKFKHSASKITFKAKLKQADQNKLADIELLELLAVSARPYHYLEQRKSA